MYYIAGLGNTGKEYENTRHNAGREIVLRFAKENNLSDFRDDKKSRSLQATGNIEGKEVVCILPENYMNNSGGSVAQYISDKNPNELIVVHDDMDIPLGTIKIVQGKGSGGHGGVESIVKTIGTKDFIRVKVGVTKISPFTKKIKKPTTEKGVIRHVLGKYGMFEKKLVEDSIKKSINALHSIIKDGPLEAMNKYNRD